MSPASVFVEEQSSDYGTSFYRCYMNATQSVGLKCISPVLDPVGCRTGRDRQGCTPGNALFSQRRPAIAIFPIHISPADQEEFRKLRPTVPGHGLAEEIVILRIHISVVRQKQFSDLRVARVSGQKPRRLDQPQMCSTPPAPSEIPTGEDEDNRYGRPYHDVRMVAQPVRQEDPEGVTRNHVSTSSP
jgi:hypothetical protein